MSATGYIQSVNHKTLEKWHQYDIQLTSRYGWDYILASASFVSQADLNGADSVTKTNHIGAKETEYIHKVRECDNISSCPDLQAEASSLGVAGYSQNLGCPVKIVWFNQTNIVRIFTFDKEIKDIRPYMLCIINRFFPKSFNKSLHKSKKSKTSITQEDRRKAALVLVILGVIWLLGAVVITLTVDGFLPIGSLWYIMAISFILMGLHWRRKKEPVQKNEKVSAKKTMLQKTPEIIDVQPEKPVLWPILNKNNSIFPFIENDRSVRIYRNKYDAQRYIGDNFIYNITTMPLNEDELGKAENLWLRYGVQTVKIYADSKNCERHNCRGNSTEYTGSMMASLILRIMQNTGGDITAEQKADLATWHSALAHQMKNIPLLVPFRYGDSADADSSADTTLHIATKGAELLSVLLKNNADSVQLWQGMSLLTKGAVGTIWKDNQLVYIGSENVIKNMLEQKNTDQIFNQQPKIMHSLFADNAKTGLHAVAAFTNMEDLRALYLNDRVAAFSFSELVPLAKEGHGLIINPGVKGLSYLINHNLMAEISQKMEQPIQFYSLPREYTVPYNVVLMKIGESKIGAVSVIRRVTGCGLNTAVELVENLPAVIKENIPLGQAELIKELFARQGAEAQIIKNE